MIRFFKKFFVEKILASCSVWTTVCGTQENGITDAADRGSEASTWRGMSGEGLVDRIVICL